MKISIIGVAALLLLTACGQKHKAVDDPTPPGVNFLQENLPSIKVSKGDPASAGAALEAMGLAATGAGRVSFASQEVNGDSAIFKTIILKAAAPSANEDFYGGATDLDFDPKVSGLFLSGAETVKADRLEVQGLRVENGAPMFGRMVLSGVTFEKTRTAPTDAFAAYEFDENGEMIEVQPDPADKAPAPKIQTRGKLGTVELVNPSPEMAAWVASLFAKGEPKPMPEGAAFAFDRWAVDDLRATTAEDGADTVVLVKRLEILDLHKERSARTLLSGLSIDSEGEAGADRVRIALKRFDLRGSKQTSASLPTAGDAEGAIMGVIGLANTNPIDPGFERLEIEGFDFNADGLSMALPQLVSKVGRDKQGQAVKFVVEPYALTLKSSESGGAGDLANQLAPLGFETLEIKGANDSVYDPQTDLLTIIKGNNFFEIKDGFRLDFSAKYEGTKAAFADAGADTFNASPMNSPVRDTMRLHRLEIALNDDGMVDRALNLMATKEGVDPAEFRKDVRQKLQGFAAMSMMAGFGDGEKSGQAQIVNELVGAVGSFIQKPKTLTIKLEPKTPIEASQLEAMNLDGLNKRDLGFSASNK